ncbi:lipopolysaccharide biosynthesis protein [Oceanicella actignis]|uniref:lipopolysaccharide biosynthesis protein n=1 Tax=Oceanicella actignis TaxID=1189325 RepID=UPI00125222E8|nr:oligosaccharide flippase family protein [Oceanicella actignis]TYO90570.1 O-antigen/teichoic acid export membrane protein [Oceanicella actignis]
MSRLARAFGGLAALNAAGAGAQFLMHAALAAALGASDYGRLSYALALATTLSLACALGWPLALLRHVHAHAAAGRWPQLRALARRALAQPMVAAALGAALLLGLGAALGRAGFALADAVAWTAALLPALTLTRLSERALQAVGRPAASLLPEQIVAPAAVLLATAAGAAGDWRAALAVYAAALAVGAGLGWRRFLTALPDEARRAAPAADPEVAGRELAALAAGMLGKRLLGRLDTLILGLVAPPAVVGAYGAASRLSQLALLGARTAGKMFPARISAAWHGGRKAEARRQLRLAAIVSLLGAAPPAALALAAPGWLLGWFGPDFAAAAPALVILTLGALVLAASGVAELALPVLGAAGAFAGAAWLAVGINAALLAALAPGWGATGAALATMAAWCALAAAQLRRLATQLR